MGDKRMVYTEKEICPNCLNQYSFKVRDERLICALCGTPVYPAKSHMEGTFIEEDPERPWHCRLFGHKWAEPNKKNVMDLDGIMLTSTTWGCARFGCYSYKLQYEHKQKAEING